MTSINTSQQLEKLMSTKINKNDIVIFYGGVNDGLLFTTGRVEGWIMGEKYVEHNAAQFNLIQKASFKLYNKFHKKSKFVERFMDPFSNELPEYLKDEAIVEDLRMQLIQSYKKSIRLSDSIAKSNQTLFFNFVQPNVFSRSPNTAYETRLINNSFLTPVSWKEALKYSTPALLEAHKQLQTEGVNSFDLTRAFDQTNSNYYLDYAHITEKGNEIIAREIFRNITGKIPENKYD